MSRLPPENDHCFHHPWHHFPSTADFFSTDNNYIFAITFLTNILLSKLTKTTNICGHYDMELQRALYLAQIIIFILTTTKFAFTLAIINNTYEDTSMAT